MQSRRRIAGLVATLTALVVLCVATWLVHGYFYDAALMQFPGASSTTTANTCTVGQPLYFGYTFTPTQDVRLTGVELVGVPSTVSVDSVFAMNSESGKYIAIGEADTISWAQGGYATDPLHPVTDVALPAGRTGGWWITAKVIPRATGIQEIQGIRVSYTAGWRSGSTTFAMRIASNCSK